MVHTQCKICEKNVFYTTADFAKAHGKPRLAPSAWVYKKEIISKNPLVFSYKWVCWVCKKENHTESCKYYSLPQPITIAPEIFAWEEYWKWWFGVNTLDLNSQRFFGKY